ncbi:MAG: hypothetical protein OXH75_01545 [Acidobacteria bacterium]|nr:hypothetical protein [Acidobacteriota bacterium]
MNDISQKISEIVAETMASKQAEISDLLDKLRADIDALQQAVSGFAAGSERPTSRRRPRPTPPAPKPRRRRQSADAAPAVAAQAAPSRTPAPRKRREKTPEEREAISKRMTAYWARKREEKAAKG